MNKTIDLENLHYLKIVEDAACCSQLNGHKSARVLKFPALEKMLVCKPRSSFRTTYFLRLKLVYVRLFLAKKL